MKYPKFYIYIGDTNRLYIELSSEKTLQITEKCNIHQSGKIEFEKGQEAKKIQVLNLFGKQLKELRLLPLVEQEPSFNFPIYSYYKAAMAYHCTVNEKFYFSITPKNELLDSYYGNDLQMPAEKEIITKQEFLAACGDFIEKANLKEVFTILND